MSFPVFKSWLKCCTFSKVDITAFRQKDSPLENSSLDFGKAKFVLNNVFFFLTRLHGKWGVPCKEPCKEVGKNGSRSDPTNHILGHFNVPWYVSNNILIISFIFWLLWPFENYCWNVEGLSIFQFFSFSKFLHWKILGKKSRKWLQKFSFFISFLKLKYRCGIMWGLF